MTARVSPTERIRAQIDELFASEGDLGQVLEEVARLATRLLLQTALEAEVTEFLGRTRYERRAGADEPREGSRNGYSPLTIKTTTGPVTLGRPKLRGTVPGGRPAPGGGPARGFWPAVCAVPCLL